MSQSRWIKRAGETYSPSSIVCVCVGTRENVVTGKIRIAESTFDHVSVTTSIRKRGIWTNPSYLRFTDRDDFWNWLHNYGSKKRCTYVYTPIASNALTLLGFWEVIDTCGAVFKKQRADWSPPLPVSPFSFGPPSDECDSESCSDSPHDKHSPKYMIQSFVMTGKVDILKYRINGRSFMWAGSNQYIDVDENELAKELKFAWLSACYSDENPSAITHNSKDRSYLWMRFHQTLSDWWISIDGGPWGQTISQLAYSFWRRRLPHRNLLVHGNDSAYSVEELAVYGGRASIWCLAPVGSEANWKSRYADYPRQRDYSPLQGTIVHIDVRAMYPSLLALRKYPVRLIGTYNNVPIGSLSDLCIGHGVIASVLLDTNEAEYPHRMNNRVLYPIGRFETTLTSPDLLYALERGHIISCSRANVYHMGDPFRDAAETLLQYRDDFINSDNKVWELLIKQLSNSLGGKLAQRQYSWIPRPEIIPPIRWGQYANVDYDQDTHNVYRCIAGMTLERVTASSSPRVLASCYAFLTGYGRQVMISLRKASQPYLVLSQDTDGLWLLVTGDVQDILKRMNTVVAPLKVRQTGAYNAGLWLSPSHYWIDGNWTLSGFRIVTVASDQLRVMSERTSNPITLGTDKAPHSIRTIREMRDLTCEIIDGTPDENGMIHPTLLRDDGTL